MSSDGRSHQQILADYAVVRIATACAIIGGDGDPVSDDFARSTIGPLAQ